MDAEIAVRDLADERRYNVLPRVVVGLGWKKSEQDLHRAPEHERLALLVSPPISTSRAALTCHISVKSPI